jgi:hypothetical protein
LLPSRSITSTWKSEVSTSRPTPNAVSLARRWLKARLTASFIDPLTPPAGFSFPVPAERLTSTRYGPTVPSGLTDAE